MPFDTLPSEDEEYDPYSSRVALAVERVGPAVAHIAVFGPRERPRGIGSGVTFTPDGYLLNHHVIAEASRLAASLPDGRQVEAASRFTNKVNQRAVTAASRSFSTQSARTRSAPMSGLPPLSVQYRI